MIATFFPKNQSGTRRMSNQEAKKAKRRKSRVQTGKPSLSSISQMKQSEASFEESGDAERIARLMDAADESEVSVPAFSRGPNPYLDREKCLLCGIDRVDPIQPAAGEVEHQVDVQGHTFSQLPLWVCPSCRRDADNDMFRKMDLKSVAEIPMPAFGLNTGQMGLPQATLSSGMALGKDLHMDSASLGLFNDINLASASEPVLPNGTLCTCESCIERRQIAAEHTRETQELQKCWTDLRTLVRDLYSQERQTLTPQESSTFRELVARLCSRDPHQLFLRLESQVRERVFEKKRHLSEKLNVGYSTPPEAREIMSTLLSEYVQLCSVSRLVSEHLTDLKEHLEMFHMTWEVHNKHLYHSIIYSDPEIQSHLEPLCDQLRNGALSKESYMEDTYPKLMRNFLDFRNEMTVILVIWQECQQRIERHSEEQAALKVKQKWLKEDWEFFRAQRKLLEQQMLKSNPRASTHSMEAQFTETMRNMLTGTKPTTEECYCPRCNRKRCPCDECTITHMITCGIINPEALETNGTHHTFNFPHDSRYVIDVTPPSMSSTTSSSASSSPLPISPAKVAAHLSTTEVDNLRNPEAPEEDSNQADEGLEEEEEDGEDEEEIEEEDNEEEEEEEEEEDGEGEEEEQEDEEEEECDAEDEEEEDEEEDEEEEEDGISEDQREFDQMLASGKLGLPMTPVTLPPASHPVPDLLKPWERELPEEPLEASTQDFPSLASCACHHCVAKPPPEPQVGTEEQGCQCHVCLQQQGQTVSTALPTSLPLPTRPAQLHLYPHIHGTLPPTPHTHPHLHLPHTAHTAHLAHAGHGTRPLLQPQLYDLHGSLQSARHPLKLEFDDSEGIQDHLYHAYGDWDNTVLDPRILLPTPHRFAAGLGSDLLPPPPLPTDPHFSVEGLTPSTPMAASHTLVMPSSILAAASTTSAFKAVAAAGFPTNISIPPAFQLPAVPSSIEDSTLAASQSVTCTSDPCINLTSALSSLPSGSSPSSLPHPPPCTRPATLGGNTTASQQQGSKEQRTYAQPCKKHTLVPISTAMPTSGKGAMPLPPTPSSHNHVNPGVPVFSSGLQAPAGKVQGSPGKAQRVGVAANQGHSCSHVQHVSHSGADGHVDPHVGGTGTCPSATSFPTTINNVSVGTSTLCADPDCPQHHDDNCDSIDDSCSEKSSSTSTSNNQKEGKYCDCCYCEFFGHGNPPVAQTSKNYAEMRERLRRRLKRRNEAKQEGGKENQPGVRSITDPLESKGLEEILKFINGGDAEAAHSGSMKALESSTSQHNLSSKAAKRARQKQRKQAEEKARQEEEERNRQNELLRQKAEAENLAKIQKESGSATSGSQKKKSKHKEEKAGKQTTPGQTTKPSTSLSSTESSKEEGAAKGSKHRLKDKNANEKIEKSLTIDASATGQPLPMKTKQEIRSPSGGRGWQQTPQQAVTVNGKESGSAKGVPVGSQSLPSIPSEIHGKCGQISGADLPAASTATNVPRNLPESPNAKKARRRLEAQHQQDAKRRLEAQEEVEKQLREVEAQAQQKQMLRQQKQQYPQQPLQQQLQHQLLQQQRQQLQNHQKQQQVQKNGQAPKGLQVAKQSPQSPQTPARQQPSQQLSQSFHSHNGKMPATPVAHQPLMSNGSPAKLQNGSVSQCAKSGHQAAPGNHITSLPGSPRAKLVQAGSNGLTAGLLSPDKKACLASMVEKNRVEVQEQVEQGKNAKSKKNKKKNKGGEVSKGVDEVFMPRSESDLENGEIDDFERELEEFKRFCFDTPSKPKIQVNVNLKDLYLKKKSSLSCS